MIVGVTFLFSNRFSTVSLQALIAVGRYGKI